MKWKKVSGKRYKAESNLYLTLIKPKDGDWELYEQVFTNSPRQLVATLTGSKEQPIEEVLKEAELIDRAITMSAFKHVGEMLSKKDT